MTFKAFLCDSVTSCDNLDLIGCHTLSGCYFLRCDKVTTKIGLSHVYARARTGIFLYTLCCHIVTNKTKSITYRVTTLINKVGISCHTGTQAIQRLQVGEFAMEWTRKSDYSFGSVEGYQVSKASGVRDGQVVWLYTAWSPKDTRIAGQGYATTRNLGTRLTAAEAAALCDEDLAAGGSQPSTV